MKKFGMFSAMSATLAMSVLAVGCKRDETTAPVAVPTVAAEQPAPAANELPPGHPPMPGAATEATAQPAMPAGHPAITGAAPAAIPGAAADGLAFEAPAEWQAKPARAMLWKVMSAPKVEGDTDDAEVTISSLAANIPLNANVERWCGQFDLEGGKPCSEAAKIRDLTGTAFPSKVVEIAGALKSASMNGPAGAAKTGWRMVVVEVTMPGKAWYLKMTGPAKTVAKWQDAYLKAASAIK